MSHGTNYKVYHIHTNTHHYLASLLALPSLICLRNLQCIGFF